MDAVHLDYELVLFLGPFSAHDFWVEHVVPPFSALTTEAAVKEPSNNDPVLRSELLDFLNKQFILLLGPLAAESELVSLLGVSELTCLRLAG